MNHFIKLPDGTIINVAHVVMVEKTDYLAQNLIQGVRIHDNQMDYEFKDPDGTIYEYFNSIAQEI